MSMHIANENDLNQSIKNIDVAIDSKQSRLSGDYGISVDNNTISLTRDNIIYDNSLEHNGKTIEIQNGMGRSVSLKSFKNINDNVKVIVDGNAFYKNNTLEHFESKNTTLYNGALANAYALKTVIVGVDGDNYGYGWFYNCKNLELVDYKTHQSDKSFYGLGAYSLENLPKLKKVLLPTTITDARIYSFVNCPLLKEIDFSETKLKSLNSRFLSNMPGLISIKLPSTISDIGGTSADTFSGCNNKLVLTIDKTIDEVKAMKNYPFGVNKSGQIIKCNDGDIVIGTLDSKSYEQNGLILQFDGIDNAGYK